jgi:hypothetical protein
MKNINTTKRMEIIELYNQHVQIKDISLRYNVSCSKLRWWLKRQPEIKWRGRNQLAVNTDYFNNIDTDNKAYIIGLLSADGSVNKKLTDWGIELQYRDTHILEEIKREIGFSGDIKYSTKLSKRGEPKKYSRLRVCNKKLVEKLINCGVGPRKTYNFSLPSCINKNNLNHFMRGFFDGDGCLSLKETDGIRGPKYSITIVCEKGFCHELKLLLDNTLNINCRISNPKKSKVVKLLHIESISSIEKFLEWIYKNAELKLERKYELYNRFKKMRTDCNRLTRRVLSDENVREVRTMLKNGISQNKISHAFNVNRGVIKNIKYNTGYVDVV